MKREIELRIPRTGDGTADWTAYRVDVSETTTLLDALEEIRTREAPDLLYRHSCHHGSCGTCACRVNGVEKLACTTRLAELDAPVVTIEPLRNAKALKDLAVFPDRLFESLPEDASYLGPTGTGTGGEGTKVRFEDCIECGSCLSACPVRKPFLGPAALAAFSRELAKRPERSREILQRTGKPDGASACERHTLCSVVCPTGVAPARLIMVLRGKSGR